MYLEAVIRAEPYYLQADVRAAVEAAAAELLSSDNIDFGEPIFLKSASMTCCRACRWSPRSR